VKPLSWQPWARRALLLAILALAFWLRVRDAGHLFVDGRLLVPGYDEYYHLRRIQKTVASFPHVAMFDAYVNYPEGADIYWPAGFDLAMATLAKLGGARPWTGDVERICAWAIPALGLVTVAAAYWLGTLWRGRAVGLLAAAGTALIPSAISVSDVGRVDHDVAVILFVAASFGCLTAGLRAEARARRMAWAAASGLLVGGTLWMWPGAIVFVLLPPAAFLARAIAAELASTGVPRSSSCSSVSSAPTPKHELGRGTQGSHSGPPAAQDLDVAAAAAGVAAIAVAALCASTPPIGLRGTSLVFLSRFHAALAAGSAVSMALLWLVMGRSGLGRWRKLMLVALSHGLLAFLLVLALPRVAAGFSTARGFLAREADLVVATADEAQGLFLWGVEDMPGSLTWAALLFPVAWAMVMGQALAGKQRPADWLLGVWAGATACLAVSQRRFGAHLAVPLALCLAALVPWAWSFLASWKPRERWLARLVFLVGFGVAAAAPTGRWRPSPYPANWELRAILPALDWLRTEAAPGGDLQDFRDPPPYAVMAFWHYGHWLTYLGHRANIACPFGNTPQHQAGLTRFMAFFGARSEREAAALCERLGVRYVLSTDLVLPLMVHLAGLDEHQLYRQEVMATSLQLWRGRRAPGERGPLQHFRLVAEFPGWAPSGRPLHTCLFEFIPGGSPH